MDYLLNISCKYRINMLLTSAYPQYFFVHKSPMKNDRRLISQRSLIQSHYLNII